MIHRIVRMFLGYSPPVSEMSGYKTLVDPTSEKNLKVPEKNPQFRGPQELPQSREKERPLPLPSDHDPKRDKIIGPTHYNTPDSTGGPSPRTKSVPGEEYGHPSKNDYSYVRRRQDVTARVTLPNPSKRQRETKGPERQKIKQNYLRNKPEKKRIEKQKYRTEDKWDPDRKRYRKRYDMYPERFERRRPGKFNTPAERTKDWREKQEQEANRAGRTPKEQAEARERKRKYGPKTAGPTSSPDWYTVTKQTVPPDQLDQNFRDRPSGTPRRDKTRQEGESLRAPNLDGKPQKGLRTRQTQPKPNSGIRMPTLQNPGDGSGKVIPNNQGFVNHTQELSDRVPSYVPNMEQAKTASLRRIVALYLVFS